MIMAIQLAIRNLMGAGLRTWLNVIVLSFSFVVIIWLKGLLDGWNHQAKGDMISWEIGTGQYWQENFDPADPFTIEDSHATLPAELELQVERGNATAILIAQGTLYPSGRMQGILIKGIDPGQQVISIPGHMLSGEFDAIPALIGSSMAKASQLETGDMVVMRWRDKNGTFDAAEIVVAGVFQTNVPTVDAGQVWIPLEQLRKMMLLPGEATLLVVSENAGGFKAFAGWRGKPQEELLQDFNTIIKAKTASSLFLFVIMLLLAMLAIFDTQVLSIFRRQKEIGTYVALGMTKKQVVGLFTVEGAMNAVLAAFFGALYGIPLLAYQATNGIFLPVKASDYGIPMAERLYPEYGLGLIFGTVLIVLVVTTIVSYWPSRKIARMKPTDALRGKIQ